MLKGEHVTLRAISRDDLPKLWAFNNDLEMELAGGGDPPMPQSLERLQADFDREAAKGGRDDAYFAIDVDGQFIGHCGLWKINPTAQTAELGIGIGDMSLWGKGYGRESIALLLNYAFHFRNFRRVRLEVNESNERAIRAYLATGFVREGSLREHVWSAGHYEDLVLMGILREEWDKSVNL